MQAGVENTGLRIRQIVIDATGQGYHIDRTFRTLCQIVQYPARRITVAHIDIGIILDPLIDIHGGCLCQGII